MLFCLVAAAATAAKSLQLCPTLCYPTDGSQPGSLVPGILQARTLEWVAISFSNAWQWKVKVKSLSRVWLFMTPWTAAYQAPPSMGFSRQEYWSGCHCLLCLVRRLQSTTSKTGLAPSLSSWWHFLLKLDTNSIGGCDQFWIMQGLHWALFRHLDLFGSICFHLMANRWGNNGNSDKLYFLGLQNHCRWWVQPWN